MFNWRTRGLGSTFPENSQQYVIVFTKQNALRSMSPREVLAVCVPHTLNVNTPVSIRLIYYM